MAKILNVESIKAQANIVQVISLFLPLIKQGDNYKTNCPFHKENTPSFVVSEAKQIYHCFGCGAGGDIFKFVQEYKKLDFIQAVEFVANQTGINIEYAKGQNTQEKSKYKEFIELNEALNEIFIKNLAEPKNEMAKKCKEYLAKRGLNAEDLSHYEIGLIPSAQEILARISGNQSVLALELGFIRKNKNGEGYYCPMSERISFALRNNQHKIAGFSARSHPYKNFKNAGKYINSSESEIFKKSSLLYRYTNAKSVIASQKSVYIVEGFMDAIVLDKMGVTNAVATCGTAFTLSHLSQIIKTPEIEIIFCFDKDEAGKEAAKRSLDLCFNARFFNVKIGWANNEVKDFAEVLEKGESLELKQMQGIKFYLRFLLKKAQNNTQKEAVLHRAREIINMCEQYYQRLDIIEQASNALKIPKQVLTSTGNANQYLHKEQRENVPRLENIVIKSALYNEQMAFLLKEVIASEGKEILGSLQEVCNDFLAGKHTPELARIELDERISIIDNEKFCQALKSLQKQHLQFEIQKAKYRKDIDLLCFLQAKARDLEMPF